LQHLMRDADAADWRTALELGPASRILLFSTEGATDPVSYRRALASFSSEPSAMD
jgi:hypothetical protein